MQWSVGDHGMVMTLARDVPERIAANLRDFVTELYARAGLDIALEGKTSLFAVHPGGPRILDGVRDVLELTESQVAHSRAVLYERGNMSSATLPHIWQRMVVDPMVVRGTLIASLAFGPGLTLCGGLFRKA
jgi:predicted naringenin-chalcone synthase